jgi:type I restriction enzyme R subunit
LDWLGRYQRVTRRLAESVARLARVFPLRRKIACASACCGPPRPLLGRPQATDLEVLKASIRVQLEKLIRLNQTRADFAQTFEELIESYNAGSRNLEELFEEWLKLSRNLSEEQQRHVRENMAEEELVILDILTRPAPELSAEERKEVKKVARELLNRLKQLLVLNWRQKAAARAQLRLTIEDVLDTGLPRVYAPDLYQQKCSAIFEHVYESYPERDAGVYAAA